MNGREYHEAQQRRRHSVDNIAFRAMLDIMMTSGPFPARESRREAFAGFLDAEAWKRGYDDWVEAYHDFDPKPEVSE